MSVTTKELAHKLSEFNGEILTESMARIYDIAKDYGIHEDCDSDYELATTGGTTTSVEMDPIDHEWWADADADAICLIAQGVTDPALVGSKVEQANVTTCGDESIGHVCTWESGHKGLHGDGQIQWSSPEHDRSPAEHGGVGGV